MERFPGAHFDTVLGRIRVFCSRRPVQIGGIMLSLGVGLLICQPGLRNTVGQMIAGPPVLEVGATRLVTPSPSQVQQLEQQVSNLQKQLAQQPAATPSPVTTALPVTHAAPVQFASVPRSTASPISQPGAGESQPLPISDPTTPLPVQVEVPSQPPQPTQPPVSSKPIPHGKKSLSSLAGRRINLNTASSEELQLLPGVGKTTAEKIISYRSTKGSFGTVDDLLKVKGVKPSLLRKLHDYLSV